MKNLFLIKFATFLISLFVGGVFAIISPSIVHAVTLYVAGDSGSDTYTKAEAQNPC